MMAGMFAMASGTMGGLYIGVLLSGLVFGGYWTIIPLAMGDLYGLGHVGANYKATTWAEAIGYLGLGRFVTARIYEAHCVGGSKTCIGVDCFRGTFLIAAGLCLTAACSSVWLSLRTTRRARMGY
jgi:hypothetical protein